MRERGAICAKCGEPFRMRRPQRGEYAYCSPECVIWGTALVKIGLRPDHSAFDIRLYKKCCRCGDLFPRDTPHLRGECHICHRARKREALKKRDTPPERCAGCGVEYHPTRGSVRLRRWKGTRKTFCSRACNRVYADARERQREAKRRQRVAAGIAVRVPPQGGTFHAKSRNADAVQYGDGR